MTSLASILNPTSSGARPPPLPAFLPSPTISSPASSFTDEIPSARQFSDYRAPLAKNKPSKEPLASSKSKPRGLINFPPFENVDDMAMQEIQRFRVTPFGAIQTCCAHIPYNSGKKDFFEKTGRESFEVFKYDFRVPGSDAEYTVMWDYNVGLVRMTPFFKCCKYGKTMPAKMLNMNPGLKDITHSITGGAISAQGYWMPYICARAVCATFCYDIAGALIPLFGPSFPSECIPPGSPAFQKMTINQHIVQEARHKAEASRRSYLHQSAAAARFGYSQDSSGLPSARLEPRSIRPMRDADRHVRVNTRMLSPYSTDSDADGYTSGPDSATSSAAGSMLRSSRHPSGTTQPAMNHTSSWTATNQIHHHHNLQYYTDQYRRSPPSRDPSAQEMPHPNPILSAIPRFATQPAGPFAFTPRSQPADQPHHHHHHHHHRNPNHHQLQDRQPQLPAVCLPKRPLHFEEDDLDQGYEGGESQNGSPAMKYIAEKRREVEAARPERNMAEKKAALLLLDLSRKEQAREQADPPSTTAGADRGTEADNDEVSSRRGSDKAKHETVRSERLSFRFGERLGGGLRAGDHGNGVASDVDGELGVHRTKRRRANSM